VSPFSFLGFEVFHRYIKSKKWNVKLNLHPFFLGGIMQATSNTPPASNPIKAQYLVKDIAMNRSYFNIPLQLPSEFPQLTLNAMRLLTAIKIHSPNHLESVSRSLWCQYWVHNQEIVSNEGLLAACTIGGLSPSKANELLALSRSQETKDALKKTTDEAVKKGAFGAPTFYVTRLNMPNEPEDMFFGSDRFPVFAHKYGLPWEGPCPSGYPIAKY